MKIIRHMQWNQRFTHYIELNNIKLYGHVYIDKVDANLSVQQAFHKFTRTKLKASFITNIEGDPIFSTKDSATNLEQLFIKSTYNKLKG